MSLKISMAASWDDAYPDPDVLQQVQHAIERHIPMNVTLHWDELRRIRYAQRVSFEVSRDYVGALEGALIDLWGRGANTVRQLDVIPFPFLVDSVDMEVPAYNMWHLYSAVTALEHWQHFPMAEQLEMERFAQAFLASDTPTHDQYRMADAYCRTALVRVATACVHHRLPARVYW